MPTPSQPPAQVRLGSIDAYRGLVMFLMMAEVLRLSAVAAKPFPTARSGNSSPTISPTSPGPAARCTT